MKRRKSNPLKTMMLFLMIVVIGLIVIRVITVSIKQGEFSLINNDKPDVEEADSSLGWNLIVVNNKYCIPHDYEFELFKLSNGKEVDVRIYPDLQAMFDDARAEGLELFVRAGYRSKEEQQELMDNKIKAYQEEGNSRKKAEELAKEYVSVPGTSEHQLGTKDEPWHYRYVGKEAALAMEQNGLCLEEYVSMLKKDM